MNMNTSKSLCRATSSPKKVFTESVEERERYARLVKPHTDVSGLSTEAANGDEEKLDSDVGGRTKGGAERRSCNSLVPTYLETDTREPRNVLYIERHNFRAKSTAEHVARDLPSWPWEDVPSLPLYFSLTLRKRLWANFRVNFRVRSRKQDRGASQSRRKSASRLGDPQKFHSSLLEFPRNFSYSWMTR